MREDGRVCFYRWLFSDAVKPQGWHFMACVVPGGINKTALGAKLILMAFPVSCASMAHLLMAQHCPLCLNVCFSPPMAPHLPPPPTPPPLIHPPPIDSIHDITAIKKSYLKNYENFSYVTVKNVNLLRQRNNCNQ